MSLNTSSLELGGALKDLRIVWEEAKAVWNDPVREQFEEQHWLPLEVRVLGGIRAMNQLAPILEKMRQECGDRSLDL